MVEMNNISPFHGTRRPPTAHYVALLLPTKIGEWRVLFPDLRECEARAFTMQDATYAATTALARCARIKGHTLPLPRSLVQIEADREWFKANGIVLGETVVTMVPLWAGTDYRP
jgi:hypothetical protein